VPSANAPLYSLNGGEVGDESLARLDLQRLQFAGSLYQNMLPRVIGSMTLRPGLEHIVNIDIGEVALLEYAYSGASALIPILSNGAMRIVKDDALVTRASVSTAITSGDFSAFTGWTDSSTGNASATASSGNLVLTGTSQDRASATQTIAVAVGDRNIEHGLRVTVARGPVSVRLGSTSGAADLIEAFDLDDGTHSIAFTPTTANIYIDLWSNRDRQVLVDACQIDAAGTLTLPTPWTTTDLEDNIVRYKQSLDVIYLASGVYQQREIQRRSDTGWGIQRYKVDDGPFVVSDGDVALTPSGFTGNITLTANKNYFDADMVGRLFRLSQAGQTVEETFAADPAEGDHIRISGVGAARDFNYELTGTWSGTVRLQKATDDGSGNPGAWADYLTFTANVSDLHTGDNQDNVINFYRWALNAGDLASGSVATKLTYAGGTRSGVVRVTGYTSATSVSVEILSRLYSTNATFEWDYSVWSDYDGWPTAVELFGGRLFWPVEGQMYGSVPDAFKSFDDTVEGDSAPIARSINATSQRGAMWLLGLQHLIAGTDISEISIKASGYDEPLTSTAWFPVDASTRGCANIRAVKADKDGIFVQSSGIGLFRMALDETGYDYNSADLMAMHEEICDGSEIVDIAVQRRPDTIIWLVLANGEARALTYEPSESVIAWSRVETDGTFSRVAVSRGAGSDRVYFAVTRNGTQRLERVALLTECRGGTLNCLADGFSRFTATADQTTFSVPHLDGLAVTVWANGTALHDQSNLYTVVGGNVVIAAQAVGNRVVIGLPYTGRWKSTKLAYGAARGTALMQRKRVAELGLYLVKTILDGFRVGYDFDHLYKFTTTKADKVIAAGTLHATFDADLMSVSSDWDTDSRVCAEAKAPYPATIAAMVLGVETHG
jgi:hypothetical protein